jgi:hypothetical protein
VRERDLRRRCRRLLRELDIRPPLDVLELCERLGRRRGRPIELYPYPIEVPGPFGLWFGLADRDCIFYQRETTAAHQAHIILHELGHMIADHPSDEEDPDSDATGVPRPGDSSDGPGGAPRARRRTCYDSRHEQEAELIATIILEWASVLDTLHPIPVQDPGLHRLDTSLGHHRGWM